MNHSRRNFIRSTTMALAGTSLVSAIPWEILAKGKNLISSNDTITVGVIGINGMGWSNLKSIMKIPEVNVVALCDVDENVLNKREMELREANIQVKTYADYRRMLENKDVDVVIIATPDHWHCLQMVDACSAGKDVYVEKPVGNSIDECRVMVDAQKKYNRVVQVGQWQRSMPHFVEALNFLQSGQLGKIRGVKSWAFLGWKKNVLVKPNTTIPPGVDYDLWLGPAPKRPFNENRFHYNFRWFWDYAGGLMTDWGVHLIDYVLLGLRDEALPKTVFASGGKYAYPDGAHETPDTMTTVYEFDNFTILWEHAAGIGNGNYGREHGIAYIGHNGTLVLDRGGWEVIADEKRMEPVHRQLSTGSGLDAHMKNFIDAVKSRNLDSLTCPIQAGAHIAHVCQMGNIAFRTGAAVHWDGNKKEFKEKEANKLIKAKYYNGYALPKI
jgi:predicted dehydrogenase